MRLASLLFLPIVLVGASFAQSTNFPVGPQYLITTASPMLLQSIATPSMSLNAPLAPLPDLPQTGQTVTNQTYSTNPALQGRANLFPIYYGYPRIVDVELTSTEPIRELPASVNDTGYLNVPSGQSLRSMGLGITLAQAAAYSKAHRRASTRVYTNEDLQRLRAQ